MKKQTLTEKLHQIADNIGVSFNTVAKVHAETKNWRNCEVRGVKIKDLIDREIGEKSYE